MPEQSAGAITTIAAAAVAVVLSLAFPADGSAAQWLPVADQDLRVQPGNVLDFSALVEAGPAGKHGRVIAMADGRMAFAKTPAKRQRFFCASQPYGVEEGFPDHDTADAYARQLRLHGYNLARFHFVDNVLMHGRSKDFDFDPEQLDRFHYFMAALKREGIYWMLDALTSWNGAYGDVGPDRWAEKRNLKLGVYLDDEDRQHWRQLVQKLLDAKNPYTGLAPLQDPALVAVITVNEGGLNSLLNHQPSAALNRKFAQWLSHQYGSVGNATKRWGADIGNGDTVNLPRREWNASARMADAQRFYYAEQSATQKWMNDYLRKLGYPGFISAFDNWFTVQDIATRRQLDLVAAHSYDDDPSAFASPGSTITQASSLPDKLAYIRDLALSRYWNKPFAVTEYDQPFWNRHRFESGLAMGAYAALQDWDVICRHASGPIELEYGERRGGRHQYLYPYAAGVDPVARAAETVAALLFLRADVKPSRHRVAIDLAPDYVFGKQAGIGFLPDALKQIGLMTGVGVRWQGGEQNMARADVVIDPDNAGPSRIGKLMKKVGKLFGSEADSRAQERLAALKKNGILPVSNASDAEAGILQSDTGQIMLNAGDSTLTVSSDKTEAIAFDTVLPTGLRRLAVKEASDPSLLAVSAMDDASLDTSARILLVFATDARNSGMAFADADQKVLKKIGGKPVLLKSSRIRFQLKHAAPDTLRLYAVKLNGERGAELPLKKTKNALEIELDTEKLPDGPTTFFELIGKS